MKNENENTILLKWETKLKKNDVYYNSVKIFMWNLIDFSKYNFIKSLNLASLKLKKK